MNRYHLEHNQPVLIRTRSGEHFAVYDSVADDFDVAEDLWPPLALFDEPVLGFRLLPVAKQPWSALLPQAIRDVSEQDFIDALLVVQNDRG